MNKLTTKGINNYLIENYGVVRHDCERLKTSCQSIAKDYGVNTVHVFHFMVEQEPIPNLYTHSYGYNTRLGREIREAFNNYYNQF
ncbi:MAG: hypothetical protein QNK97_04385 [Gammaproteobacteria bacterium]|jgi:hypothetical protein